MKMCHKIDPHFSFLLRSHIENNLQLFFFWTRGNFFQVWVEGVIGPFVHGFNTRSLKKGISTL